MNISLYTLKNADEFSKTYFYVFDHNILLVQTLRDKIQFYHLYEKDESINHLRNVWRTRIKESNYTYDPNDTLFIEIVSEDIERFLLKVKKAYEYRDIFIPEMYH